MSAPFAEKSVPLSRMRVFEGGKPEESFGSHNRNPSSETVTRDIRLKWGRLLYRHQMGVFNRAALLHPEYMLMFDENFLHDYANTSQVHTFARYAEKHGFEAALKHWIAGKGILHDTTAVETIKLLRILDGTDQRDISFTARTQWGKTGLMICLELLGNTLMRVRERPEQLIIVNTMRNGADKETKEDYLAYRDTLSFFRFAKHSHLSVQAANPRGELRVMKRNGKSRDSNLFDIEDDIEQMKEEGNFPVLLCDEFDEGINVNGLMHRLKLQFNDAGLECRRISITATSREHDGIESFISVEAEKLMPGCGYTGLLHGDQFYVGGMTSLSELTNSDLSTFDLAAHWKSKVGLVANAINSIMKRGLFPKKSAVVSEYHGGVLTKTPAQGGRGLIVRYGNTMQARHLVKTLKSTLKDVVVIEYFSDFILKGMTVSESIKKLAGEDKSYIIVVSGAARRADRFPADCVVFLDFTKKVSGDTAYQQSGAGRISGWGKFVPGERCPALFMMDKEAEKAFNTRERYAMTGEILELGKPTRFGTKINGERATRMRKKIKVYMSEYPELKAHLEKMLLPLVSWSDPSARRPQGTCRVHNLKNALAAFGSKLPKYIKHELDEEGNSQWFLDFYTMLDEAMIAKIEADAAKTSNPAPVILRPGKTSLSGNVLITRGKFHRFAFGNDQRGANAPDKGDEAVVKGDDTGVRGDRNGGATTQDGSKTDRLRRLTNIMWVKNGGNISLSSLSINLFNSTRDLCTATVMPNANSALWNDMTDEERAAVLEVHTKKKRGPRGPYNKRGAK